MKNMILVLLMLLSSSICLFGEYSAFNMGIGVEPVISSPSIDITDVLWGITADMDYSMRTALGEGGYFALFASAKVGAILDDPFFLHDKELFSTELGLDSGKGRFVGSAAFLSSVNGTLLDPSFYIPSWELKYYFLTARDLPNLFVAYTGNVSMRPDNNEDIVLTGGETGFEYRPTATSEYSVRLGAWWEHWYEYQLYNFGGSLSDDLRNDFVSLVSLKAGGLFEFILQWDIEISAQLRISNANRYVTSLLFYEESSENNILVSIGSTLGFAWNKFVNLEIVPQIGYQQYFSRQALGDSGALLDENAFLIHAGSLIHLDWTFNDLVYFVLEFSVKRDFSNDAEKDKWNCRAFLGVKMAF